MAFAYQTGAATSPTDLLTKLVTFLVANGWTSDASFGEGAGWRAHLHNGANYVHMRAAMNENIWSNFGAQAGYSIGMYVGTAYNGAAAWDNQTTGAPIGIAVSYPMGLSMPLSVGPFVNHYFFTDGSNVVVVVEKVSGIFDHMGWGASLNKFGTWTGGAYFFASSGGRFAHQADAPPQNGFDTTSNCPCANQDAHGGGCFFLRADVDSWTGKWIGFTANPGAFFGTTGKGGMTSVAGAGAQVPFASVPIYATGVADPQNFQTLQTSQQDGRANLLPIHVYVLRDGTTTGLSPVGTIPNIYFTNGVGNGFSKGSEYTIGANVYKMFPNFAVQKA